MQDMPMVPPNGWEQANDCCAWHSSSIEGLQSSAGDSERCRAIPLCSKTPTKMGRRRVPWIGYTVLKRHVS